MMPLTPKQLAILIRIVNAAGVWRRFVFVDALRMNGMSCLALVRRGLLERRYLRGKTMSPQFRPTVLGIEIARGRETEACNGSETGVQCT